MEVILNPVGIVFENWSEKIKDIVGEGNYSMNLSSTVSKTPYARLYLMGNQGYSHDLTGNENATSLSFSVESFASGNKASSKAYEIDSLSHQAMVDMGFRRTFGPELMENADKTIQRVVSRYNRIYTGCL